MFYDLVVCNLGLEFRVNVAEARASDRRASHRFDRRAVAQPIPERTRSPVRKRERLDWGRMERVHLIARTGELTPPGRSSRAR